MSSEFSISDLVPRYTLGRHTLIHGDCSYPATLRLARGTQPIALMVMDVPFMGWSDVPAYLAWAHAWWDVVEQVQPARVLWWKHLNLLEVLTHASLHYVAAEISLLQYENAPTAEAMIFMLRQERNGQNMTMVNREYTKKASTWHPAAKDPDMLVPFLKRLAPGSIVLDPTAGSGSTLWACEHTGHTAICIESHKEYITNLREDWHEAKVD